MRNNFSCRSEFVWNVHIQVTLKVIRSVFQFSTCMSLLRHGCHRHSFMNSQTDSQMYTFPDQMNWQFVQILMDSKFQSKLRVLDTDDVKQKTSLFSVQGKSAWYVFMVFCSFVYVIWPGTQNKCPNSHHSHPVHLFNTWIYPECKVQNGWSHRKPYICSSFDFLIQYSANGTCLTSVNMHEYVTSLWLLWRSYIFPDLYWNSLTWLTGND